MTLNVAIKHHKNITGEMKAGLIELLGFYLPERPVNQWPKSLMERATAFFELLANAPVEAEASELLAECVENLAKANLHQLTSILFSSKSSALNSLSLVDKQKTVNQCIRFAIEQWNASQAIYYATWGKNILPADDVTQLFSSVDVELFNMVQKPESTIKAINAAIAWLPFYDKLKSDDTDVTKRICQITAIIAEGTQITGKNKLTEALLHLFQIANSLNIDLVRCANCDSFNILVIKLFTCPLKLSAKAFDDRLQEMRAVANFNNSQELEDLRLAHMHCMMQLMPNAIKGLNTTALDQYFEKNWRPFIKQCIDQGLGMKAFRFLNLASFSLLYLQQMSLLYKSVSQQMQMSVEISEKLREAAICQTEKIWPRFKSLKDDQEQIFDMAADFMLNHGNKLKENSNTNIDMIEVASSQIAKFIELQMEGITTQSNKKAKNNQELAYLKASIKMSIQLFDDTIAHWALARQTMSMRGSTRAHMDKVTETVCAANEIVMKLAEKFQPEIKREEA